VGRAESAGRGDRAGVVRRGGDVERRLRLRRSQPADRETVRRRRRRHGRQVGALHLRRRRRRFGVRRRRRRHVIRVLRRADRPVSVGAGRRSITRARRNLHRRFFRNALGAHRSTRQRPRPSPSSPTLARNDFFGFFWGRKGVADRMQFARLDGNRAVVSRSLLRSRCSEDFSACGRAGDT
jgi:hypothetical protein